MSLIADRPHHGQAASETRDHTPHGGVGALALGALGVVYGDIGTSPLYAMDQIFRVAPSHEPEDALGAVSLVIWTLTLIVAIKYAVFVLRAQNDGEGGVFALYGLLHDRTDRRARMLLWALMAGAGLLIGDGMITPAISVLSAVEGLGVAAPGFAGLAVPITLGLLVALFAIQFKGASGVGAVFGPVVLVWFVGIAALGAAAIAANPEILAAFNPVHGLAFLGRAHLIEALLILGALMLVVTGGEAMYADVGHFGALPIRLSWFAVVYPALLLNYLGQGAYRMGGTPVADGKLFFALAPHWLVMPMVILATAATVIASQALISGAFSLMSQAIRLGLFPRLDIEHTHHAQEGQVYIPVVNWMLLIGCVTLVWTFGSAASLAAAYGLAVSGVMVITSVAMISVALRKWRWRPATTVLVWGPLTTLNASFFAASLLKLFEGGYVPIAVGSVAFAAMATWRWGRKATYAAQNAKATMTMGEVVSLHRSSGRYLERNALIMSPRPLHSLRDRAPLLIRLIAERTGVLPRNLVFVEVAHKKTPYIHGSRYQVTIFDRNEQKGNVIGVELSFGFLEEPNVERTLEELARHHEIDLPSDPHQWIVHVMQENLLPPRRSNVFKRMRLYLFLFLRQVSRPAYSYYGLGDEVQLTVEIVPVRLR
ncbi:MAG TPA: KUP/HAK/KT family potassium transporter [Roseiarcus sp.]|nr:KUP/HAK/KT family potassium transporter [Roseiarcus sp.]